MSISATSKLIDDRTVFLMSSGQGPQSRIYKTTDGGASWMLLTTNLEPKGFWDCMGFWDATHGIIVGDPVDGRFTIMTTSDGATWQKVKGPSANKDEGAFAASGTCVFTRGTREAWFGTGGVGGARVFHSEDGGQTWSIAKTPIRHDSANAGIFSLAFSDALHGIAVGGDYMKPDESAGTLAITNDGGKTWIAGTLPRLPIGCLVPRFERLRRHRDFGFRLFVRWREELEERSAAEGYNAIGGIRRRIAKRPTSLL